MGRKKTCSVITKAFFFWGWHSFVKFYPGWTTYHHKVYLKIKFLNLNYKHIAHNTIGIIFWKLTMCITRAVFGAWLKTNNNLWWLRKFVLGSQSASKAFGFMINKTGHICKTHTWNEEGRSDIRLPRNTAAATSGLFSMFDRPSREITKYNALFLMCANKVKENEYNLTPLSIFIQKVQGVGYFTKSTQMPLRSEVHLDVHPCLQFHIGLL